MGSLKHVHAGDMVYTLGTRGSVPKGTKEQLQALETENERLRQLVGVFVRCMS